MAFVDLTRTSAASLASESHEELLNMIDGLRSRGVSKHIDLPQLIVCGDQSSGKSSVLEAISGLKFPTKDNLCTRFATEVILRRGEEAPVTVSIIANEDKSKEEKELIRDFKRTNVKLEDFEQIVKDSAKPMGIDKTSKRFSKDILRVELSGPKHPNLTLVDLPGLFHSASKDQSYDDADAVKDLVLSYMRRSRSIILAIISAKSDINNQVVTRHAIEVDPKRCRTLGIITKPDTLDTGSESEKKFFDLAENKDEVLNFELGWHVLRNRDYETRDASAVNRDRAEADFFGKGIWKSLPSADLGIARLRRKLSDVLKDQIINELPGLIKDVGVAIQDFRSRLQRLGDSRETVIEQRMHLLRVSEKFGRLTKDAVDGQYDDTFFKEGRSSGGYRRRLRAVVQNTLTDFAAEIQENGQTYKIVDRHPTRLVDGKVEEYREEGVLTRDEYLDGVANLLRRTRGRELPGTFNPQIIGELFSEQAQRWPDIIGEFVDFLLDAAKDTLTSVLHHTADRTTCEGILHHIINPAMIEIDATVRKEAESVLKPYQRGHPVTYNHYLTDNIQKAREAAFKRTLQGKLQEFLRYNGNTIDHNGNVILGKGFNEKAMINALCQSPETDMNRHACNEAVDCMQAYYKVAMKTLVDAFSTLTIEECLLKKLSGLLTPEVVMKLSDTTVTDIAAESERSKEDRESWSGALKVLEDTLRTLHRLDRHKPRERRKRTHREIEKPHLWKSKPSTTVKLPAKQQPAAIITSQPAPVIKLRVGGRSAKKAKTAPPPEPAYLFFRQPSHGSRTPRRSSIWFGLDKFNAVNGFLY